MEERIFDLNRFDEYKEGNRREVKKAKGGLPVSLWDTYSAFANCYGGVIILGVIENDDKSWRTTGLKAEDAEKLVKSFWDTVNNRNKVSINLLNDADLETFTVGEDLILVIYVPQAKREFKPVFINDNLMGGTFRRNGEGDYHCTPAEVRAMLRDATEDTPDMKILEETDLSVIDIESLHAYRNRHKAWRPGHVFELDTDEEYLRKIGAAAYGKDNKLHPTAAGLLMFGHEYDIVLEFPEFFLDYREMLDPTIRWTDRLQSSSGDWTGNIMDFFFRVYNKAVKDVKVPFKLDGIVRVDDTPVHKAIREAIINCLVNADYFIPRGVVIKKDADTLILENPGSIRTGKEQMLRGGTSDPRNKILLKMFNLIGYGERAGTGVPDILSVWEQQNWKTPEITEQYGPDRTIVELSFVEKTVDKKQPIKTVDKKQPIKNADKKLSEKTLHHIDKIMEYLSIHGDSTANEVADYIGVSSSRAKTILREMENIEKLGSNKNRKYRLK